MTGWRGDPGPGAASAGCGPTRADCRRSGQTSARSQVGRRRRGSAGRRRRRRSGAAVPQSSTLGGALLPLPAPSPAQTAAMKPVDSRTRFISPNSTSESFASMTAVSIYCPAGNVCSRYCLCSCQSPVCVFPSIWCLVTAPVPSVLYIYSVHSVLSALRVSVC